MGIGTESSKMGMVEAGDMDGATTAATGEEEEEDTEAE